MCFQIFTEIFAHIFYDLFKKICFYFFFRLVGLAKKHTIHTHRKLSNSLDEMYNGMLSFIWLNVSVNFYSHYTR